MGHGLGTNDLSIWLEFRTQTVSQSLHRLDHGFLFRAQLFEKSFGSKGVHVVDLVSTYSLSTVLDGLMCVAAFVEMSFC